MSKAGSIGGGTRERHWIIPGTLAVIALLFRLLFYSQLRATPFFSHFYSDSRLYAEIAANILSGDTAHSAVFMSALYPVFLAFIQDRLGDIAVWARLVQIATGCGTVLLTYLTASRLFNKAGYFAGLLAAMYPAFIFYDNLILIESFLTFLIILHLYALLRGIERQTYVWPAGAGLAMGGMIALRGSFILFLPVFAVYLWRRNSIDGSKLLFAGVYAAFILLVLVPFSVRNSTIAGEFIPLSSSFGLNLYAGNNPHSDGRYALPEKFDSYRDPMGQGVAEKAEGRPLTPTEVSAFWAAKSMDWIGDNPGAFLGLLGKKLAMMFHHGEIQQTGLSMGFVRMQYDTVLDLPLPPFILMLALAIAGVVFSWKWNADRALMLLFLLTFIGSTAVFFVNDRLRTPMVVILALFAGYALARALEAVKAKSFRQPGSIFAGAAVVTLVLSILQPAIPVTYDMEYSRLGDASFSAGEYSAAEHYFARSVQERPSAVNLTNLGNAFAAQKKFDEAEHAYEDAIRMDDAYAPAFFNKGNMAHERGKAEVAFRYWGKTVQLDPGYAPAYRNMGLLLMQAGRLPEARAILVKYTEVERNPARQNEIRRDISQIDDILRRNPQANTP